MRVIEIERGQPTGWFASLEHGEQVLELAHHRIRFPLLNLR